MSTRRGTMRIHNSRPQPKPRNAPLSAPPLCPPLTPESAACLLCKGPRWLSITLATPARYEKKQEGSEAKQPACENAKGWDPQPRSPAGSAKFRSLEQTSNPAAGHKERSHSLLACWRPASFLQLAASQSAISLQRVPFRSVRRRFP